MNMEELVAKRAVEEYRKLIQERKETENILKDKKFKLNDYVETIDTNYIDNYFGVVGNSIGKIVGYDEYYDYYRVRYSEENPFIGRKEEKLKLYDGDINKLDSELINYDPNEVTHIRNFKIKK